MEQFEKVCNGLELTKSNPIEGWAYRGEGFDGAMVHTSTALIAAALALIRQQQERIKELEAARTARVLTLEEVKSKKMCWIEFEERVFPAIYYCQGNNKRFSVFIVNGESDIFDDYEDDMTDNEIWLENNFINQLWRPWSAQPTDEQREDTKWDE